VKATAQRVTPEEATLPTVEGYRVLARKYRPTKLSEVIGQDFLVQTLQRGLEGGRLGHAFILTGIRGTGKTTTARIIARALNCLAGPTPEPCGTCSSCTAIAQDRSMDVIEIDAASRTSVDDMREIIEAARYRAVASTYKIYIIDEVHMLSKSAFNALLKTLEEPPAHVKFIFATTEIHKVPATILSRCVRFDLKRIEATTLATYFKTLCEQETVTYDDEAITLIVKAAEGSVRDGLSLLDQAITYGTSAEGQPHVATLNVRKMLGLSDQGAILDLFQSILEGNVQQALEKLRYFYQEGADATRILEELLDLTHWFQCLKINADLAQDIALSPEKREKGLALIQSLSIPTLTRVWQMLLKGFDEIKRAPSPQQALEVIVIRLTHLSPLPSVQDLLNGLGPEPEKKKP
jgi:DNA polymerase-3 subunit gamma/tau